MSQLTLVDLRSALHGFMPAVTLESFSQPDQHQTRMRLTARLESELTLIDEELQHAPHVAEQRIEQFARRYQAEAIKGFGIQPIIDAAAQPEIDKRTALIAKLESDVERISEGVRLEGSDLEPIERARQRGRQTALRDVIAQLKAL